MPAYFGHWIGATNRHDFEKPITTRSDLKAEYNNTLLFRIGEYILCKKGRSRTANDHEQDFIKVAVDEIKGNKKLRGKYFSDVDIKALHWKITS